MNMKMVLLIPMLSCISLHAFTLWNNTSRKIILTNVECHPLYPRRTYAQTKHEKIISQQLYVSKQGDLYLEPGNLNKVIDGLDDHIGIALNERGDGTIYTQKFVREMFTVFNNTSQDVCVEYADNLSSRAECTI